MRSTVAVGGGVVAELRHGTDPCTAALHFAMANPTVSAIIPGARSATRAVQNAASIRSRIAPAFWSARKRDGLVEANAPVPA